MSRGDRYEMIAKVVEVTPQQTVWIELENGHRLLGHSSQKEREKLTKLLPGDQVSVALTPCDLSQGRIFLGKK